MNPEDYIGREQTFIKHTLLNNYLYRLFMIIGRYEKSISYVDCFAGPWQEGRDDLQDTSIAISLNIIQKCQEWLRKLGKNVQFRALYIEKDKKSFGRLESFLAKKEWGEVDAKPLLGEFHEHRDDVLKWCGERDFTFFFIDPTGWREAVEIPTLRPLLQRHNSEFLITFMLDFLRRFHYHSELEEQMKEIFGEILDTSEMTSEQRETYFLRKYREHLKSAQLETGRNLRSAYAKILHPLKDRTMYDMVYLTRHPLGIVEFMKVSDKLEFIQKNSRAQAQQTRREDKTGQKEFSLKSTNIEYDEENFRLSEVKDYWLSKLSYEPKQFGVTVLADMIEETDWFINDFQIAFKELLDEGKVENLDAENIKKRKTHFVKFTANNSNGESLKKIK